VSAHRVIGVDLGGTKILAGLVDREGNVLRRHERPTPTASQAELLEGLAGAVDAVGRREVAAVGVGVPSTVDQRDGSAVASVNIPLADVSLRSHFASRFDLPVGIENDANAAALAEWTFGAGRGTRHMVMLTLGTGIGGGLILDGRLYRGAVGAAAELGHIVIDHDGIPCQGACTGRGHLEVLASGTAADAAATELYGPSGTSEQLVERARAGETAAVAALGGLARRLGSGIASFVNIFNPEIVVLGGGFASVGELLFAPAREVVAREARPPSGETVRIVPAELGNEAGLVGAALVAFEALDAA